jgi:4-hydroxyacetophenone monooxygenase
MLIYCHDLSDYLESLKKPNVETISSPVERFTEHAFVTADGKSHDVDVVVLATGYDVVRCL